MWEVFNCVHNAMNHYKEEKKTTKKNKLRKYNNNKRQKVTFKFKFYNSVSQRKKKTGRVEISCSKKKK